MLEEASRALDRSKAEIERMKKLKISFVAEFRAVLNKYAEMIEAEIADDES
jgi:cell division initiation protein